MKIPQTKQYSVYKNLVLQDKRSLKLNFTSDNRLHYVYRVKDINNVEYYYGSRTSKEKNILDDLNKYGTSSKRKNLILENKVNFNFKILKVFDNPGDKICYEAFLHQYFNVKLHNKFWNKSNQTPFGFDTTGVPSTFKKHTDATKLKMKGRVISEETRIKLSVVNKGKPKPNLSKTMKGKAMYKDKAGKVLRLNKYDEKVLSGEYISIKIGYKASNETKKKMSESREGYIFLDETKKKISESNGFNIKIYDDKGIEKYYCTNGFSKFCKTNNLPLTLFKTSYQNNIVINSRTIKYKIWNGWFARRV